MKKLSVIICTHQPKPEYLQRVLAGLRAQTLPPEQWELVIIDNASNPPLELDLQWHESARLVRELKPGLTHARLAGLRNSTAGLIVMVDDDNVLSPTYLAQALEIYESAPHLGAWGCNCVPEFEVKPSPEIAPYLAALGINNVRRSQWSNFHDSFRTAPMGGGMCVRREVFSAYERKMAERPARADHDRTGAQLLSGSDWDLAMTSVDIGLGTAVYTELQLTHLIRKERLSLEYLERLHFGIGYSMTWIRHFRGILVVPYLESRLAAWISEWRRPRIARQLARAERRGFQKAWREIRALRQSEKQPS